MADQTNSSILYKHMSHVTVMMNKSSVAIVVRFWLYIFVSDGNSLDLEGVIMSRAVLRPHRVLTRVREEAS